MRKEVARPDGCVYGAQRWIPPLTQRLGHALSGTEENVDNVSNETVQWTLTDHVNALTAHWTDQLNTVRDISARHNPGYCQLRPTNAWQRGPKAGQPRLGGGKGATTVVNHLIYDAFGKVTSESKNLSENLKIGVIPRARFSFRIGSNPATGDVFLLDTSPLLVSNSLFLFPGRPFDSDTQLRNNLNRWYDFRVGRWLSEDPIGFAAGDGNLYSYVFQSSMTFVDPVGLACHRIQRKYNIQLKNWRGALLLVGTIGLYDSMRLKAEADFVAQICDISCPNRNVGKEVTICASTPSQLNSFAHFNTTAQNYPDATMHSPLVVLT